MKPLDLSYDLWIEPLRGKAHKTDAKVKSPPPAQIEHDGKILYFAYQDLPGGYVVYRSVKLS